MDTLLKKMRSLLISIGSRYVNRIAQKRLETQHSDLWQALQTYMARSGSTGCSYSDYWTLYHYVRKEKPKEILECGTGVSTLVLAYALMENEQDGHGTGRITSMEELEQYFDTALDLMPAKFRNYVDFVLSPKVEDTYFIYRGVRYREVPDRRYNFVFVDGPGTIAPSDGTLTFDFDYLRVVMNSQHPVFAIVDSRLLACYVFQKVFGVSKVRYDVLRKLTYIGPCSKGDLRIITKSSGPALKHSLRLFRSTVFHLKMEPQLTSECGE